MSEFQMFVSAIGVFFGGLTIAGAGIGAYVAVMTRLAVNDSRVSALEKSHHEHMKTFHYHSRSTDQ